MVTKIMLENQCEILNRLTKNEYYIGYENGKCHLFMKAGNGRATIDYGNTKNLLSEKLWCLINVLEREARDV